MSVASRIGQLEKALGSGEACGCTPGFDIYTYYPGAPGFDGRGNESKPDPDPMICAKCGRAREVVILAVVYDDPLPRAELGIELDLPELLRGRDIGGGNHN